VEKQGIIVDERFNAGGFIPDFFVERLMRKTWTYWSNRDHESFRTPGQSIDGPKCILANEYAGSGGDAFPFYFRQQGVGPIIGKRTWGGLVGISHDLPLENHGVDPDIEVENTPESGVDGKDLQLEKAIEWTLAQLKEHPVVRTPHPAYKKR
jgi:tricorn protease